MGEMADYALDQISDMDELQQRYQTFEEASADGVQELLYDYSGVRFPHAYSGIGNHRRKPVPPIVTKTTNGKQKTGSNVVDRIGPLVIPKYTKTLIYGQGKTGKTRLWSSGEGPILAVICSGGKDPGELKSVLIENRSKVKTVTLESVQELPDIAKHVEQSGKYKMVVLDHVTGFQRLHLKEFLGLPEIPQMLSWGMMDQGRWGKVTSQAIELLSPFLNVKTDVVIVGQEMEREPKEGSEIAVTTIGLALSGALAGWVYTCVDLICQTCKVANVEKVVSKINGTNVTTERRLPGVKYAVRVGGSESHPTGLRNPRKVELPEFIYEPSFAKLKELIN